MASRCRLAGVAFDPGCDRRPLGEIPHATDLRKATQVLQAMMMKMVKFDIDPLQDAYVRPR